MKKISTIMIKVITLILIVFAVESCNKKNLTDLNKNPDVIDYLIPEYSFTAAVYNSIPGENYRALGQGLQYFSTYKEVPAVGDKFYSFSGTTGNFGIYNGQMNRLMRIMETIPGEENVNKRAACEILRILAFHRQTDLMGDLPYSEAMMGNDNLKPKYDTQESIYLAMLSELESALLSMDLSKPDIWGSADPYFKGDVQKWKKLGYTLMLRLGMRMSDVKPEVAKLWVEKAAAGGVMTDFSDIAYIPYADVTGEMNPRVAGPGSQSLINGDFVSPGGDNVEGSKWSAKFINHLKNTHDPRLPVLSVVWVPSGTSYIPDNNPDDQRGMENASLNTRPSDFNTYSEPSLLYLDRSSPIISLGTAEAYLLLAEGALRGWNVGTDAETAYNNGVRAAMQQWLLWPSVPPHSNTISSADVSAYLAENPYLKNESFEVQLEQISTQKWVSMLGDDYEVYSNWRRTKYPVFNYANWVNPDGTKSSYPGNVTGGKMWRRFSIPNSERNVNADNYFEAIKRQGFTEDQIDLLQGRVWWDIGPGTGQNP